jgi:hypothetical protein
MNVSRICRALPGQHRYAGHRSKRFFCREAAAATFKTAWPA